MCNYHYSDLNKGHQCPYSELYRSLRKSSPQGLKALCSELTLPIDSEGVCLFHSDQEDWKRSNQFMRHFVELINLLETLEDIEYFDFKEFRFVGEPDSFIKKGQIINVIKLQNLVVNKEVRFGGARFLDRVVFEEVKLNKGGEFINTIFEDQLSITKSSIGFVQWNKSIFTRRVDFNECHFTGSFIDFSDNDFMESVFFNQIVFNGMTLFDDTQFNTSNIQDNGVRFADVTSNDHLSFKNTVFFCPVEFRRAIFNQNTEFLDTVFHPSKSSARYATNDVFFNRIGIGENGLLTFKGRDFDHKIFDTEVEFLLDEKMKGAIHFENVNFQKIAHNSRVRLLQLEKLGFVEIGKGCLKYRYQTDPKTIKIDKGCQALVIDMAQTFSNYFSVENGVNLGVEIIEKLDEYVKYFYFSDENIGEKEFHDRLVFTEEKLWRLLYEGPGNGDMSDVEDQSNAIVQQTKKDAFINAVDAFSNLISTCLKVSARITLGKWNPEDTRALTEAIQFNKIPVCNYESLHQVIINHYSYNQTVFGALKVDQKQIIKRSK